MPALVSAACLASLGAFGASTLDHVDMLIGTEGTGSQYGGMMPSWERGTNENRNGIVRMVLPKGRSFEDILNAELDRIDHLLNDRPMKCLDWRTPREAHNALLRRHALADAA